MVLWHHCMFIIIIAGTVRMMLTSDSQGGFRFLDDVDRHSGSSMAALQDKKIIYQFQGINS